jgi:hypothetical protein
MLILVVIECLTNSERRKREAEAAARLEQSERLLSSLFMIAALGAVGAALEDLESLGREESQENVPAYARTPQPGESSLGGMGLRFDGSGVCAAGVPYPPPPPYFPPADPVHPNSV